MAKRNRKQYLAAWRKANPEKVRAHDVQKKYGINLEEYDTLLSMGCALCGSFERLGLDHCHKTGNNRKALCNRCNLMLGWADDNIALLQKGIEYLSGGATE